MVAGKLVWEISEQLQIRSRDRRWSKGFNSPGLVRRAESPYSGKHEEAIP